jgi:UDP-N-acetylglucosamine--N-acetylmuramyl-(pentapeptide) pyrophosphoryl-undecaprenol N-acetylglucosamine transferase
MAVAEELMLRGCDTLLLVSAKDVDQQIVKSAAGAEFATLPSVGMTKGRRWQFVKGFIQSYRQARKLFAARGPQAVLAMGGFTSAPPVLAGRSVGALTYLHESNTIPGRANRWLALVVDQAFIGFPQAAGRLHHPNILRTGTPVRPQFQPADAGSCRVALGLHPLRPVVLVMGGSQGASGVNDLMLRALPQLLRAAPELQFLHMTGPGELDKVKAGYALHQGKAVVRPFLSEMDLALGAATVAVSRAGASSLAELAAMRVPSVLVPYPFAADNHQSSNARAFVETGAALMMEQKGATGESLSTALLSLLTEKEAREQMMKALDRWHVPEAAELIAERIVTCVATANSRRTRSPANPSNRGGDRVVQRVARGGVVDSGAIPRSNVKSEFQPGRELA